MALLQAVEVASFAKGMHPIRIEGGIKNTAGKALYRRAGYKGFGPFGSYKHSPISLFLERTLQELHIVDT